MNIIINEVIKFIVTHWRIFAAVGAFLLLLAVVLLFRGCGDSQPVLDEKQVQQDQDAIQKREEERLSNNLQKSNEVLANTGNVTKQAEANTKEAMNKDFTNTSLDNANAARCKAYPSSRGCK